MKTIKRKSKTILFLSLTIIFILSLSTINATNDLNTTDTLELQEQTVTPETVTPEITSNQDNLVQKPSLEVNTIQKVKPNTKEIEETQENTNLKQQVASVKTTPSNQISLKSAGSTYYVSLTGNDDDDGTETNPYQSIGKALNQTDVQTIIIADGNYTGSNNMNLNINKSVTFKANNTGMVILDGLKTTSTMFNINNTNLNVTFDGINFTGGNNIGTAKCINVVGTDVVLNILNCSFYNMNDSSGRIIYSYTNNCSLICTNSIFKNNWGQGSCILIQNRGGVKSYLNITNCTFMDNRASNRGAIWVPSGSIVYITDSTFINNSNANIGSSINSESNMTVKNCNFINDSAKYSGASIGGEQGYYDIVFTIINCSFENGSAGSKGGAIFMYGSLEIYNSTFNNLHADSEYAGAIWSGNADNKTTLYIYNSTFENNTSLGFNKAYSSMNNSPGAGAIFTYSDTVIELSSFINNKVNLTDGGAIILERVVY